MIPVLASKRASVPVGCLVVVEVIRVEAGSLRPGASVRVRAEFLQVVAFEDGPRSGVRSEFVSPPGTVSIGGEVAEVLRPAFCGSGRGAVVVLELP